MKPLTYVRTPLMLLHTNARSGMGVDGHYMRIYPKVILWQQGKRQKVWKRTCVLAHACVRNLNFMHTSGTSCTGQVTRRYEVKER